MFLRISFLLLMALPALAQTPTQAPANSSAASHEPETRWARSADEKRELAKGVVWTTHEPLEFLERRGDHSFDESVRYGRMYDPANLQRMADAGVKWGRLYFYKGFG